MKFLQWNSTVQYIFSIWFKYNEHIVMLLSADTRFVRDLFWLVTEPQDHSRRRASTTDSFAP